MEIGDATRFDEPAMAICDGNVDTRNADGCG